VNIVPINPPAVNLNNNNNVTNNDTPSPKEFGTQGIRLTLTDDYIDYEAEGYTAVYISTEDFSMAIILKEYFADFAAFAMDANAMTLTDYAQLVISVGGLDSMVNERNGVTYFTYSTDTHSYFSTVFKGTDAFWLVQFAALNADL
jgi:hypothetical protein